MKLNFFSYLFLLLITAVILITAKPVFASIYTGSKPDFSSNSWCTSGYSCYTTGDLYVWTTSNTTKYFALNCPDGYSPPSPPINSSSFWPLVARKNSTYLGFIVNHQSNSCNYSSWTWTGSDWNGTQNNGGDVNITGGFSNNVFSSSNIYFWDGYGSGSIDSGYNISNDSVTDDQLLFSSAYTGLPFINVKSASYSAQLQQTSMNFEGDIGSTSAQMHCDIAIHEKCVSNTASASAIQSVFSVAHIILDASAPLTETTQYSSGSYFYGYGFSPSSSAWKVDNVILPYHALSTCSYPMLISCYDGADLSRTPIILSSTDSGTWSNGYPPSTVADIFNEPMAWLFNRLKDMMEYFFIPSFSPSASTYNQLNSALSSKAPFAYFIAATQLNTTAPASNTLSFSIPVAVDNSYSIPKTINYVANSEINTLFATFKTFVTFMFWVLFTIYLLFIPRRLFHGI
jgi:hypothetical protein